MQNTILAAKSLAVVLALVGFNGCNRGQSGGAAPSKGATAADEHGHAHADEHGHGGVGPHGGQLIELGAEEYHAELLHDEATHRVGIYLLDGSAKAAAPTNAGAILINCMAGGKPTQFTLNAAPLPGEAAGNASFFELTSPEFSAAIDAPGANARLNVTVGGKPYVGSIEGAHGHDHAAGHGHSHAGDDALVWRKEIDDQGYAIALGHHGKTLEAGHDVEPAVQITRAGQPVADARVFNSLLSADGQTVLAKEVATVYEPPTSDEPAHYAQGALKIPADKRPLIIRYRIVLPAAGERTFDVPVTVE